MGVALGVAAAKPASQGTIRGWIIWCNVHSPLRVAAMDEALIADKRVFDQFVVQLSMVPKYIHKRSR